MYNTNNIEYNKLEKLYNQLKEEYNDLLINQEKDRKESLRIREELLNKEYLLQVTENIAMVGTWEFDLETNEIVCTEQLYSLFEVNNDFKFTIENLTQFFSSEDKESFLNSITKIKEDGFQFKEEYELHSINNKKKWLSVLGKIEPEFYKLYITIQDISERKKTEEDLKKLNHYNRSLLEASLDPLVTIDHRGKITDLNLATELATGISKQQMIGTNFTDYFSDPDLAWLGYKRVFDSGFVKDYPLEIKRLDGHLIPVIYNASLYFDQSGEIQGIFAAARDITDRIKAETEIKAKNNELAETLAAKDKFFSIIAHDLKSPFSGFLGLTKIMAEELQELSIRELQEYSISLSASAKNLFKLLENLLEWSRMQRGLVEFNPEEVNISDLVQQNITIADESLKLKTISIANNIHTDLKCYCDSKMTSAVIRNLIANAIKFTNKGGQIEIGSVYSEDETKTCFYINDTGIGMDKELLSKLFKIEQKVSREGTEGESSTGIGLLLCKEFIEKQGGKIWAESVEGNGSTFYFTLPNLKFI